MLFKRRRPPSFFEKLRVWLWPRRSFLRSYRYFIKRILRLSADPRTVALGVAAGVFATFTPFVGFHFIISFIVAYIIGGNMLAAAVGTSFGNPLTFPLMWSATYNVGSYMLGRPLTDWQYIPQLRAPDAYDFQSLSLFFDQLWPIIKPMAVGSIPLGVAMGIFVYGLTLKAVERYQLRRREAIMARASRKSPDERP